MLVVIPRQYCEAGKRILIDQQDRAEVISICKQFKVKVSSGYRSSTRNLVAGGASNSDHLRGQAADFVGSPDAMNALYKWAQGRFPYTEPRELSGTHVHISFQHQGSTIGQSGGVTTNLPASGLTTQEQLQSAGCATSLMAFLVLFNVGIYLFHHVL